MSERPRPAGRADPPPALLDTGLPVTLTRTSFGVAGTVAGPSGTVLLTVTLHAEPPEDDAPDAPDALLVVAAGVVDLCTAPLLEAALVDAVDRHAMVRCDLSDVRLLSAAGITALVNAHQRAAQAGCRLTVHGAHGITRRVLQITGVEHLLGGQ